MVIDVWVQNGPNWQRNGQKTTGEMGFYVGLANPALFHNEAKRMISSLLESGNHSAGWDKH